MTDERRKAIWAIYGKNLFANFSFMYLLSLMAGSVHIYINNFYQIEREEIIKLS